ncbi:hypothetical protein BGX28_010325 [Mortierella sp. GBA30]|nr:hypothetical protein BGX28_010325 [Mortierella sp. GBA30]
MAERRYLNEDTGSLQDIQDQDSAHSESGVEEYLHYDTSSNRLNAGSHHEPAGDTPRIGSRTQHHGATENGMWHEKLLNNVQDGNSGGVATSSSDSASKDSERGFQGWRNINDIQYDFKRLRDEMEQYKTFHAPTQSVSYACDQQGPAIEVPPVYQLECRFRVPLSRDSENFFAESQCSRVRIL